jgi:hypothetical protein
MEEHLHPQQTNQRDFRRRRSIRALSLNIITNEIQILELDPTDVAEQVCLIDHDLLKAIMPSEFLQKNFDNPKLSPNFTSMVNKFNEVSSREEPLQQSLTHFLSTSGLCG